MDDVLKNAAAILGLIAVAIAVIAGCVRLIRWLFGLGKGKQAEVDQLKTLTEGIVKVAEHGDKTLQLLEEHCKNQSLHVNAEPQTFIREEDKAFKNEVRLKLDELIKGK